MERKTENRMIGMAAVVMMIIFALSFLCSCGAKKTVTETITEYVHDTVRTVKTDTIKDVRVQIVKDTVRSVESHYFTVNNVGDTIKEVHHYHDTQTTIIVDSTNRYQAKVDSLQRLVNKLKDTNKVVRKGIVIPWWAWITTPLILLIGGGFIVRKILNWKWHIT